MSGVFRSVGAFSEGFDWTTTPSQIFSSAAAGTISSTFARFPAPNAGFVSQGIQISGSSAPALGLGVQLPTMIGAIAAQPPALPTSGQAPFFSFWDSVSGATQVSICFNAGGNIVAQRGDIVHGITILGTSTTAVSAGAYHQYQIQVTINATTGFVEVLLDGNPTPILSLSGINTSQTGHAYTDTVLLGGGGAGFTCNYDDWWMLDKTGALSTYLGDRRMLSPLLTADSATGGLNQFSTSPSQTSGNHYKNVNAVVPNLGTSFNFSATATNRESYRTSQIPQTVGAISWVNVKAMIQKDDANARSYALTARNSATDTIGDTISTPSSWAYGYMPFLNDPSTSAPWTISGYNGAGPNSSAEFGIEIIS